MVSLGFQRGQSSKQALNIGLEVKIASWLDEMKVRNYTINDDLTIDVAAVVNLWKRLNGNLPDFIKFGHVSGYFDIGHNYLTSLKGSPQSVNGNFNCNDNILSSLEGAPKYIKGGLFGINNKVQFTKEDVRKVCNVKGEIHV